MAKKASKTNPHIIEEGFVVKVTEEMGAVYYMYNEDSDVCLYPTRKAAELQKEANDRMARGTSTIHPAKLVIE